MGSNFLNSNSVPGFCAVAVRVGLCSSLLEGEEKL